MVMGVFPARSETFVTQQVARAGDEWDVHVLARTEGLQEDWAFARSLGVMPFQVSYANFFKTIPLPIWPSCWTPQVCIAAEKWRYGRIVSLRRQLYFARLLSHPSIRSAQLIHTQWTQQALEVGLPLSRILNVPISVSANDSVCVQQIDREGLWPTLRNELQGIVTLSDWSFNIWRDKFGEDSRLRRVYLGVDLARYSATIPARKNDVPIIINVGRCAKQKRQWDLIEAVALLSKRGTNVRAIIVGDGPERESLRSLSHTLQIAHLIDLRGAMPNGEVITTLRSADIFVLTSEWESFGLVTAEAMAAYLPTVVSQGGASPELVEEGQTGFTFAPGDIEGMVARLQQLIADRPLRERMGQAARGRVELLFSLDTHIREMNEFWHWVLEHNCSSGSRRGTG